MAEKIGAVKEHEISRNSGEHDYYLPSLRPVCRKPSQDVSDFPPAVRSWYRSLTFLTCRIIAGATPGGADAAIAREKSSIFTDAVPPVSVALSNSFIMSSKPKSFTSSGIASSK
jgi:hypothetical protein